MTDSKTQRRMRARWRNMLCRCEKPSGPSYAYYGGRGIYVCERWHCFDHYREDVGDPPSPAHTLDRIDNDGSYTCGKCPQCVEMRQRPNLRWATPRQQQNNTRHNRWVTHRGRTLTVAQWSRLTGILQPTIHQRLRRGLPLEEVFSSSCLRSARTPVVCRIPKQP